MRSVGALSVASVITNARHHLGRLGEQLAAEHLTRLGYDLVARNHRTRFGELDLVVSSPGVLVFCEVKARRRGSGHPWDSLGEGKRLQVRRMASAYLAEVRERPRTASIRFDAIGVVLDGADRLVSLEHLEGAF